MDRLETLQRCESLRDAAQVALSDRQHVPHVAVFGNLAEQRLCGGERLGKLALFEQAADFQDFGLDAGLGRVECCGGHPGSLKKRRALLPALESTAERPVRTAADRLGVRRRSWR